MLDTQQPLHTAPKNIGGNHNGDWRERIRRLERSNFFNEGGFERGLEWTSNNVEHKRPGTAN